MDLPEYLENEPIPQDQPKWSEERINKILDLRGEDGNLINVFDLHGLLFIGTCQEEEFLDRSSVYPKIVYQKGWNLEKTFQRFSSHDISMRIENFEYCENEEDIRNTFHEMLKEAVMENIL